MCRAGRRGRLGRGRGLIRIEAVDARAKLAVLVAELPVGFGQTFQTRRQTPRFCERSKGHEDGDTGNEPQ